MQAHRYLNMKKLLFLFSFLLSCSCYATDPDSLTCIPTPVARQAARDLVRLDHLQRRVVTLERGLVVTTYQRDQYAEIAEAQRQRLGQCDEVVEVERDARQIAEGRASRRAQELEASERRVFTWRVVAGVLAVVLVGTAF